MIGSVCNARTQAAMNRTAVIGPKSMVQIAPWRAPVSSEESMQDHNLQASKLDPSVNEEFDHDEGLRHDEAHCRD